MRVNCLGVMVGCQRAARHMAEHGGGSIVNTTSIGGINAGGGLMTYRADEGRGHPPHPVRRDRRRRARHPRELRRAGPHPDRRSTRTYDQGAIVRLMQPLQRIGSPRRRGERGRCSSPATGRRRSPGSCCRSTAARPPGRPMVKFEDVVADRPDAKPK